MAPTIAPTGIPTPPPRALNSNFPAGQGAGGSGLPAPPQPCRASRSTISAAGGAAPPPPSRVQIPTAPPPQATVARAEARWRRPGQGCRRPRRRPQRLPPRPPPSARKVAAIPPAPREAAQPKVSSAVVTASTSGYVAVLSSQKSRMDALKAFADLQQKYGDVLSSKTPDVQEANLGDKGVWLSGRPLVRRYRAMRHRVYVRS